jgi:hypothetical protein
VLAALAVAVGGCSGVKLAYRHLDWTVPVYVETYVALDGYQRGRLRAHLDALLSWHCSHHLEAYAWWLRGLAEEVRAGGPTPEGLERRSAALDAFWRDLAGEASPRVADLLLTASDAQLAELFDSFADSNGDFRRDFVAAPPASVERRLARDLEGRLEDWVGPLTAEQRERVLVWGARVRPGQDRRLVARERWQGALRGAMDLRADPAAFTQELDVLLRFPERLWSEDYRDRFAFVRDSVFDLLVGIGASLSPGQRHRLVTRLERWAEDLGDLACSGGGAPVAET